MDGMLIIVSAAIGAIPVILKFFRSIPELAVFWNFMQRIGLFEIFKRFGIEVPADKGTYDERMAKLIAKFNEVTAETDTIVSELENNVRSKASRVKELEQQHETLLTRIETLKQSPQYADLQTQAMLEKFMREQNRDGRRSTWRDYGLFILGLITPPLLNLLLTKLGITSNP